MQVRRLKAIFQVSEPRRFAELEVGLAQLGRSVMALAADAELLTEARRFQGAAVLQGFADEEAAKALILLDIARCGWTDAASVSSCMAAFYNHLSRGLYAEVYAGRPADLEDIRKYVDALRRQFYLDGPTGIDWVFRNSVIDDRETALYVDYVQTSGRSRRTTPSLGRRSQSCEIPSRFPWDRPDRTDASMRRHTF
ncbi:AbiV family abortive infection protein [Rhodococcus sp. Q1]|uniref:AbiV family abortive infection protein n=1 Tax=Rhodococcus sp. Q1 TaxID=2508718 RepID=UPI0013EA496F|nr:AbiV family abortive infection protein [Rhodococcus sp. Q1]